MVEVRYLSSKRWKNIFSLLEKSELTYLFHVGTGNGIWEKQGRLRMHYECVIFINWHFMEDRDTRNGIRDIAVYQAWFIY